MQPLGSIGIQFGPFGNLIKSWSCFSLCTQIVGDYYHFQHRKLAKRSTEAAANHEEGLNSESRVKEEEGQILVLTGTLRP